MVMKTKFLLCSAMATLLLPAAVFAQDVQPPPERPNWEQLRERLQNLTPEERQAKIRELRERFGQMRDEGAPIQRPFQGQGGLQAGRMAGGPGGGLERIGMVLTPEQRQSVRQLMEDNQDKVRELEEKLRDARKAALEVALEKNFNEDTLRQKLEAAAKLDTELLLLRARAFAKIDPPLSAGQIEQIKNPPPPGEMMRRRGGSGPDGAPDGRPFRDQMRPRPSGDGPRDENDLPPPARP